MGSSDPFPTRRCASECDLSRAPLARYLKVPFLLRKAHLSVNCVWCVLKWKQHLESLSLIAEIYHKMNKCNRWWLVLHHACGAWIFIQTSGCWAVSNAEPTDPCSLHFPISVLLLRLGPGSSSALNSGLGMLWDALSESGPYSLTQLVAVLPSSSISSSYGLHIFLRLLSVSKGWMHCWRHSVKESLWSLYLVW